jgi:methionine biosynthesis protein MetW
MKKEFKIISELIENNTRALDVGCGDGTLMKYLKDEKHVDTRGLEISKKNVQDCTSKGLFVIEGNAEKDLHQFPNLSFDYVILSQTLQAFYNPEKVINDLLRVANKAIVTIPNFGHWKVRIHLLLKGTMPVTAAGPNARKCWNYSLGSCKNGNNCTMRHEGLSNAEKATRDEAVERGTWSAPSAAADGGSQQSW